MNHLLHAQKIYQNASPHPRRRDMWKGRKVLRRKSNASSNLQGHGIASKADQSATETRHCLRTSQKGKLMSQRHRMQNHPLTPPLLLLPYQTLLKRSPHLLLSPRSKRSDFLPSRRTSPGPFLPRVAPRTNQQLENLAPSLLKQRVALVLRKKTLRIHYRH